MLAMFPSPLAGEWRNNLKEGRGIYRYPKGGVYEGEWRGGLQEGVGVRTFASGQVQVRQRRRWQRRGQRRCGGVACAAACWFPCPACMPG